MNNLIHGSTEENYYPRYFILSVKDPDYINVYAIYAGQSVKKIKKKLVEYYAFSRTSYQYSTS